MVNEKQAGTAREATYPLVFRTVPVVDGRTLLLACAVLGWIPVVCVREVLVTDQPIDEVIQLWSVAAMAVFVLGWLTYAWLGDRHFGESVCRLLALPTASGESFEAEIECNLPLDSRAPVVVRLRSQAALGKRPKLHWQVEQHVDSSDIRRLGGRRVVVPVRLNTPRGQRAVRRDGTSSSAVWTLEITRKSRGLNFRAHFVMPVADLYDLASRPPAS